MEHVQAFLLLLDGNEGRALKKLNRAGLEKVRVSYPMLPRPIGSHQTVWWANAAGMLNGLAGEGSGDRVFYWGSSRFLGRFLDCLATRSDDEAIIWEYWERVPQNGVSRFYGALGTFIPQNVQRLAAPTHLGNRFFGSTLAGEFARVGVPFERIGKPWPTPQEELMTSKGSAKVTLALIAKDEEEFLAGCIEQALPYVDDIVVVETGSRDHTVEIAESYGARVVKRPWQQDFAAARNAYLETIKDGWVITLDADEYLTPEAGMWLRRLAEKGEPKVYLLRTYNYHSEVTAHFSDQANVRLVWRAPDLCYTGRIHEQLCTALPREYVGGPFVLHYGYLPSVSARKGKLVRNDEILSETVREGTPFDWYNRGLNLLSMNKPEEALKALEEYFGLEAPGAVQYRPSAYWHAARAALAIGKNDLALEYAERACEAPLPECYFTKAQVLEALGRVEEALAAYREAANVPDPPASLYQVFNQSDSSIKLWRASLAAAVLLEKEKRYVEAQQEYKRALAGDMQNLGALLGLARIARIQGRPHEALKWARRASEIHQGVPQAHMEYIEALLAARELREARSYLGRDELPLPDKDTLYLRIADAAIQERDFQLASDAAGVVLEHDGTSTSALILKARSLRRLGLLDEAEALLRDAPAGPEVENELGALALARRRLDEAEERFRTVLAKDADNCAAATNLAQALILQGRVEEALAVIHPFVTSGNESLSSEAVLLAGRCLNSLHRYVDALNVLSFLDPAALRPGELFELHLVRGNAHFGLEEWEEAADSYFAAFDLNPDDAELLYRVGLLMLKLRRWEDAENAFLRVQQLEPNRQNVPVLLETAQSMRLLAQR